MHTFRPLTAVAVLLATALAGIPALSTSADAKVGGDGDSVSRAADRYGMSEASLRDLLKADPSLRVAGAGLYYVDPAPKKKAERTRVIGQAFPLSQTFLLHSKAGSQRTIYLDFDGQNVSDTWWNQSQGGTLANGNHPAWTLDGDPSTFNDTEKMFIQDVFQRVAEDYAPFDVDVTTQEPSPAAIIRTDANDQVYGTRALITPSASAINAICGGNCGGVAFIDVFDLQNPTGIAQPAWIFPQVLGPNDPKYVADATTHEVGHNLSLMHDGTTSQGYYEGHSNLWGPIMGAPYDVPITQWGLNQYPDAQLGGPDGDPDGLQPNPDDIATISGSGAPFRTDEPGSSIGTAGAVPGVGYISSRTDADYFSLGSCSGTVTVTANNAEVSPNLDIEAQLLSANGTVLDTDNPAVAPVDYTTASGMDATASANVAAGTYYVRIDGVGPGNTSTAYDDYGSVGAYTLQVSGCGGPVVTAPSAPQNLAGVHQGGGVVDLTWSAPANNGGGTITGYNVYADDVLLGTSAGLTAHITGAPPGEHDFAVGAVNSAGEGPRSHVTVDTTDDPDPEAVPGKARIGQAKQGRSGGAKTATVSWQPPAGVTNPPIDGFEFIAYKQNRQGRYVRVFSKEFDEVFAVVKYTTPRGGLHKFAVRAHNALGYGPLSAKSNAVRPR